MSERQKRPTILDIAAEAGVSAATVSRVLGNSGYPVSDGLRRRIREVAERLDYRPNIFGRGLKGGVNKAIGVIVPSIANPFYSQFVSDVESHCIDGGYAPIICSSHDSPSLEQKHLEMLLEQQAAGILLSTINTSPKFVKRLNAIPAPCVLFDQPLAGFDGGAVIFDFEEGGRIAVQHLIDRGHRRIAFATRPLDRASRQQVYAGYRKALVANDLPLDADLVAVAPPDGAGGEFSHGRLLAEALLARDQLPHAVVAASDILAIGIINAFRERGIRVPRDISVIGFDDIDFASVLTPGLTTIRQSTAKTAEMAIGLLYRSMGAEEREAHRLPLEPELIERESVGTKRQATTTRRRKT